jgi:hypothetical protein
MNEIQASKQTAELSSAVADHHCRYMRVPRHGRVLRMARHCHHVCEAAVEALPHPSNSRGGALLHFMTAELKPLLGLFLVPYWLVTEVLMSTYQEGQLRGDMLLCGTSLGRANGCIARYTFARLWHPDPPLPEGCDTDLLVLQESNKEMREMLSQARRSPSLFSGAPQLCVHPDLTASPLTQILPGEPALYNFCGIALLLPLYLSCLAAFLRHAGSLHWRAGDGDYLCFTAKLYAKPWIRTLTNATAVASLTLCSVGLCRLYGMGGSVWNFVQDAMVLVALQFVSLYSLLSAGAQEPHINTRSNAFSRLRVSRVGSRLLQSNEALVHDLEHAALIGDRRQLSEWFCVEEGIDDLLAALPRPHSQSPAKASSPKSPTRRPQSRSRSRSRGTRSDGSVRARMPDPDRGPSQRVRAR